MKRKFKQILAALIVAIMLVGIAPMSEINYVPKASAKDISSYSVGDTITYGSYPQTKVTDRGLIAKLKQQERTILGQTTTTMQEQESLMTAK